MGIKKIAAHLKDILGSSGVSNKTQVHTVKKLMGKLEQKCVRLTEKLEDTTDKREIKKLQRKLKRCSIQLEKGKQALSDLDQDKPELNR